MGEPVITLRGVSKRFYFDTHRSNSLREWFIRRVLHHPLPARPVAFSITGMDLCMRRGESVALVGQNGSGKSTLLRLIAGIYRPTSGRVICEGSVAAVLELGAGFHDELTGKDNVAVYAAALGLNRRELADRYDEIVRFADIGDVLDKPIKHYSTGMRARLALGVALCMEPDILLMDESLSVGDRLFRRKVYDRLERFQAGGGTLVLVSHDLDLLQQLCRRVIWLRDGRIEADGDAATVLETYHQAK